MTLDAVVQQAYSKTEYEKSDSRLGESVGVALLYMVFILSPLLIASIAGVFSFFFSVLAALAVGFLLLVSSARLNGRSVGLITAFPVAISVFQNIYLGLLTNWLDSTVIQIALLLNFLSAIVVILAFQFSAGKSKPIQGGEFVIWLALLMLLSACLSVAAKGFNGTAAISSLRNFLTPFIFLLLGYVAYSWRSSLGIYLLSFVYLTWFVVVFGLFERLMPLDFWGYLNLGELWQKKGIPNVSQWGVPANFFSSEKILGEHVRRMVSSFADPVNLGTFIGLSVIVAWYLGRPMMLIFSLVVLALAMSKGALLTALVLFVCYVFFIRGGFMGTLSLVGAGSLGVGVIVYAYLFSSQSLAAHVNGLWSAVKGLPAYPFGHGLGGVGVLAGGAVVDIRESGIGVIIGQLGLPGILCFGLMLFILLKRSLRIVDVRRKVVAIAALLSISLNIAFNEVALSPNSCAAYFTLIGFLLAEQYRDAAKYD